MAAAAACGSNSSVLTVPLGTRGHSRKNSRRRQAALLFLNNISLDGRPVHNSSTQNGGSCDNKETPLEGTSSGSAAATADSCSESEPTISYGTLTGFSGSQCGADVTPNLIPRTGLTVIPPILVLPSEPGFNDAGSAELLLGCHRGSVPSPGSSNLLSLSPLGPRKSSTLLSVQSCNSVSSEPRPR